MTDQTTAQLTLHAVPIAPDDNALTRLVDLALRDTDRYPEGNERPVPLAAHLLAERVHHWQYGAHRYGARLITVSPRTWVNLAGREARTPEDWLHKWNEEGTTPAALAEILDREGQQIRQAVLEQTSARTPPQTEEHAFLQEDAEAGLELIELFYRRGDRTRMAAAIRDVLSVLSSHVVGTDADSPLTGEVYFMLATGTQFSPDSGVSGNHQALVELLISLHAAAHEPLPALPAAPAPNALPGSDEPRTLTDLWTRLLADALWRLERVVHREIIAQHRLWTWVQAQGEETLGPHTEQVRTALRDDLSQSVAQGGELHHWAPEDGAAAVPDWYLARIRQQFEDPRGNVRRAMHAAPEVQQDLIRTHQPWRQAELDNLQQTLLAAQADALKQEFADLRRSLGLPQDDRV